eukprot:scaffold3178_cov282-Pinguiococcus_pyrenoidosus.AAC.2
MKRAAQSLDAEAPSNVPRSFVAWPFAYHEELTLKVDSLTNMGTGIARVSLDKDTLARKDAALESADRNRSKRRRRNRPSEADLRQVRAFEDKPRLWCCSCCCCKLTKLRGRGVAW